MAVELESLLVALEVDNRELRTKMRQFENDAARFEKTSKARFGNAGKSFDRFADGVVLRLGQLGAAYAAYLATQKAVAAINIAGSLNRDAKAVGLTVKEYQELTFAVQATGISLEQFRGSAGQFASQMGELRANTGGFYEFLRNHLPTVLAQLQATKNVGEAYGVVAEAAAELQSQEERNIFVAKAFGEEGRKLTYLFEQGKTALDGYKREAHDMGAVLSDDVANAADETSRKFTVLSEALEKKFQGAVVSIAGVVLPVLEDIDESLFRTITAMEQAEREANASSFDEFSQEISEMSVLMDDAAKSADKLRLAIAEQPAANFLAGFSEVAKNVEIQGKLALKSKQQTDLEALGWDATVNREAYDAFRQLQRDKLALNKDTLGLIAMDAEDELEKFRQMLVEKQITETEFAEARAQINANAALRIAQVYKEEQAATQEAIDGIVAEIDNSLSGALHDAFSGNVKSTQEYFRSLIAGLGEAIVQATILKPLMDSLSQAASSSGFTAGVSSFLSGRATGGSVNAGTPYVVGERGPEVIIPKSASNVRQGSAGVGGTTVYNIDARNADVGVERRIARTLESIERQRKPAAAQLGEASRRYPTRG